MGHRSEAPMTPLSGLINRLGQLPELRKTISLLESWLSLKGHDSNSQMEELHRVRSVQGA